MAGWSGGIFTRARNWAQDKLNSINPQAALFDQEDDNFATGLNNCVTKDGTNKPSTTMDWNLQRLSNLGAPTTAFDALRQDASASSFTGTLTGMSSATTGTIKYYKGNNTVALFIDGSILGTSNSNAMQMTGLPAAINPGATRTGPCAFLADNGASVMGSFSVSNSNVITFSPYLGGVFTTFTTSGNKGLAAGWSITYPL